MEIDMRKKSVLLQLFSRASEYTVETSVTSGSTKLFRKKVIMIVLLIMMTMPLNFLKINSEKSILTGNLTYGIILLHGNSQLDVDDHVMNHDN